MSISVAKEHDHFDLLPYVAILICVLGTLLLVTLGNAAVSIGPGAAEGWIVTPDGSGTDKMPVLVEWDGRILIVHGDGPPMRIPWLQEPGDSADGKATQMKTGTRGQPRSLEMKRVLAEFASRQRTHFPLFAVRPSGFDNFQRLADDFRNRKIQVGYEPIAQERALRLMSQEVKQ